MLRRLLFLCLLFCPSLSFVAFGYAQGTHLWSESSFNDWEKGTPKGVAIGSDGIVSSGLPIRTVAQLNAADVWAIASDARGNAYLATGSPAQVLRIAPDGTQTVLFTTKDVSVQSLAMGPDGALYAATLPSAKVFRIAGAPAGAPGGGAGKPLDETTAPLVFDPGATEAKPKYIWAMLVDSAGRLYLASGGPGAIYRLSPGANAKPELLFASDEPNLRSLALAPNGDLLAGSDGTGLVYRIQPDGKGLVLFEAAKREITSLAVGSAGQLYVAAVGEKGRSTSLPQLPVSTGGAPGGGTITVTVVQPGSAQSVNNNAGIPDGSEVYIVPPGPAEAPRRLVAAHEDVIYSLRATASGLLAATGNRGRVYRLHDDGSFEDLVHADAGQVVGFAPGPDGSVYLPAANSGKLLRLELGSAEGGVLESEVFDATEPSLWGRAEITADTSPESYRFETRTGNVDNPARGWGDWKPFRNADPTLGQPAARYAQWRLTLKPGARISQIALNYLPANAAPEVDEILVAPGTRVNSAAIQPSYPPQTTINFASQGGAAVNLDANSAAVALSAFRDKGSVTARWAAHDDNGDELRFALFYRAAGETGWRLLKDNLTDRYYSFDASLLPDGPYRMRVVATDAASHPAGAALTGERVSDLFLVDTSTPQVTALDAQRAGAGVHVVATVTDAKTPIARAEYSLDAGPWQYVEPVGRLSDSLREQYDFQIPAPAAGAHIVALRAFDRFENQGSSQVQVR